MPGTKHIEPGRDGKPTDFSELIAHAQKCPPPTEIEHGEIIGGFAHHQVIELAPKIIELVKEGKIRNKQQVGKKEGDQKNGRKKFDACVYYL